MNIADRLANLYSGAVYDILRSRGLTEQVLPPSLQPLDPSITLAGPVFTLTGEIDQGLDAHESLLLWTEFLGAAPAGSVVVCQPHDNTVSHMGELSGETLKLRGVRGYVVDGGCRDISFLQELRFPVWCRYRTPRDIVGRWAVRGLGEPIEIGGVRIRAGDYLIADQDGVVIVPSEHAEEVVEEAEQVVATEDLVRKAILKGVHPQTAYLQYGKF
jgi:4-hydroxy-4-methyl-2-oxoglutarate aldolase